MTINASATSLWPPNGKRVPNTMTGVVNDGLAGVDPTTLTFRVIDEYGAVQPAARSQSELTAASRSRST